MVQYWSLNLFICQSQTPIPIITNDLLWAQIFNKLVIFVTLINESREGIEKRTFYEVVLRVMIIDWHKKSVVEALRQNHWTQQCKIRPFGIIHNVVDELCWICEIIDRNERLWPQAELNQQIKIWI